MGSPSAGGCLALAALVMQCLLLPHVSAHPHPPTAATPTHAETAATTSSSSQDAVAEEAGRVLGSSVVTSVSVIADGEGVGGVSNGTSTRTYNPEPPARSQQGTKKRPQPQAAQGTVAAPAARPATVASPAGLMSPDRYEFYTFDETGDLVRRHMTLDEIKSLLAGGDGDMGDTPIATFYHGPVPAPPRAPTRAPAHHHAQGMLAGLEDPEDALEDAVKGVQDVVNNVQNVLKSQLAASKNKLPAYIRPPPAHGAPNPAEAAATWAMILPGIMDGGLPPKPPTSVPTSPTPASPQRPTTIKTHGKKPLTSQSSTTAKKPLNKKTTTTTAVPAASKEEPPVRFTLAPTTEQDIVDTLYTLVSSSPGLKHTASNNASDLPPLRPRPTQPPPRPATPRPQRPATPQRPAITAPHRVAAKPHPAKPVATKPAPSKTASSKPGARPVPKPVTKPFRPAEQVQQRRPVPQQDHAESMVQIVTVPRPVTTTTMAPFVTFIPTELSETSVTTASPSSPPTSPLTSPTTSPPPSPVTSQLTTFATRRPPAISYTYRGTTTTSTETPTFTETVSSADLDMDSRTTAEEEDAESTVTTTTPARTSPAGTSPTLTTTTGSSTSRATEPPTTSLPTTTSPTIWTTNPPTTTFTPVRAVTRDPPNRITTQFATTLLPAEDETTATSEQATDATPVPAPVTTVPVDSKPPVRYTEILTRVPASALVTKAVPEDDAEQTSTIISTLPTTERDEVNALTTAFSKASDDTTEVAEDEDDDSAEQVSEESIDDSAETEGTTKLYLKISSSENNGFLFSSSTTEASAADMVTPTMEVETKPTAVTSSETFVTDQSAASTEHRGTTASLPASSEEAESRTESDLETTVDEETSASLTTKTPLTTETEAYTTNQPTSTAVPTTTSTAVPTTTSTAVPTTTSAALTSQSTAGPTSTSTKAASQSPTQYSAASTTRTTTLTTRTTPLTTPSELSLESSNILTSQVDAPQTPQASGLKMVPTPATSVPTSLSVEVDLNKVDKLDNKVDIVEASSPASQPQPLWTRVPVVSSAEDEDGVKPVDGVEEAVKVYHSPQPSAVDLQAAPQEHLGLEAATATLDPDVRSFVNLCNELAFQMWMAVKERSASTTSRSIVMSPFAATSTLAMVFLGARGPTSGQMNDVLRLDDMVSFNPHQVMWNVTEALVRPKTKNTGVATAALVRELYSDKNKGKLLDFYKERAQQFYEGHVEEITFRNSGDLVRRKTNLLVKRQTRGRVQEYMRGASLALRGPLAAFGANIFETDCTGASTEGRDGEMHFVVVPSSRQRRLVPVPAAVWRSGFLAGYDPALDATAVAVGPADATFSTVLVLPGQQGHVAPGDGLSRLEQRLLESRGPSARWARLLRTLLPRPGLELQVPRFSHRSVLNMSEALQRMGLDELFSSEHADLRGLNGVANDLHLSDVVQLNTFSTCGERAVDSRHHVEFFPTSPLASPGRRAARGRRLRPKVAETDDPRIEVHPDNVGKDRDSYYARVGDALEAAEARGSSGLTSSEEVMASEDASSSSSSISSSSREARTFQRIADFEDPDLMKVPLALRPRQARIPEAARLRFDRPFLFFVRHNPTGVLLHMGRFNPRLLP